MVRRIGIALAAFLILSVFLVASASVPHLIPTVSAMGTIRLLITDPPHYSDNVTSINITFTQIALNQVNPTGNETWIFLTNSSTTIDLLKLVNVTESLGSFQVPIGNYSQIRFMASNATATINDMIVNLTISSGEQTGLKVHFQTPFQVTTNGTVTITVDITADDSDIHNGLKLTPSLKATVTYS
jgi:hypothetical protein